MSALKSKKNSASKGVPQSASKANKVNVTTISEYSDQEPHVQRILQVRELMMLRDQARMGSEYVKADQLRDRLKQEFGVDVIDQRQKSMPSGWKFTDGTSKKLPARFILPEAFREKRQKHEDFISKLTSNIDATPAAEKTNKRKLEKNKEQPSSSSKKKSDAPVDPKVVSDSGSAKKKMKVTEEKGRNEKLLQSVLGSGTSSGGSRTVQGVLIEELQQGNASGPTAAAGQRVKVQYTGRLKSNGKVFDSSGKRPFAFRLGRGEVIRGWDIGVAGMRIGGKRRLTIPPEKAYGKSGSPPVIPPNATLVFDVTLIETR